MDATTTREEQLAELVSQVTPGMHLCSSDYRAWGDVLEVEHADGARAEAAVLVGRVRSSGRLVHVPATAALEIRGGKCVRLDTPFDELDHKGYDVDVRA